MSYDFLFVNKNIGVNSRKDISAYIQYLHKYNLYNEFVEKFVSKQIVKPKEFVVRFGESKINSSVDESLITLNKSDSILMLEHDQRANYTNLFGLNRDFIPTLEEIDMIKNSWIGNEEEIDDAVLNEKYFNVDFNFEYRKPKLKKEEINEEEQKYCAVQKTAIMLFDFYKANDYDFQKKYKNNNIIENQTAIDEIFERITNSAVNDFEHIKELRTTNNQKEADMIIGLLESYCVTRIDYLKRLSELNQKGISQGIDMALTTEDMIREGIIKDSSEYPSIPALFKALEKRYEAGIQRKIEEEREAARLLQEKIAKEKETQRGEDEKLFKEINLKAKKLGFNGDIQQFNGENIAVIYDDNFSFRIASVDVNGKANGISIKDYNHDELIKASEYVSKLEQSMSDLAKNIEKDTSTPIVSENSVQGVNESNEHRAFWKAEKPEYVNDFKYEKTIPYVLRGRQQFCCWKLQWVESGKFIKDDRGLYVLDENGQKQLLPLKDAAGNIVYDKETGKPKPDGKWAKVPVNGRKPKYNANASDPKTWCTFSEACKAVRESNGELAGIGIMLGNGLIGGDLDNAFKTNPDGSFVLDEKGNRVLNEDKAEILKIANTYWEVSPSKTGVHFLSFGHLPEGITRKRNDEKGLEFYGEKRFFTLTGDVMPGMFKLLQRKDSGTQNIKEIYDKYMGGTEPEKKNEKMVVVWDDTPNQLGLTTEQIINKLIAQGERRKNQETIPQFAKDKFGKIIYDEENGKPKVCGSKKNPYYGINVEDDLLNGRWEHLYENQSVADFSLLSKAKYYTTSAKQLDEIMRNSGLMRDKWDELRGFQTYGQLTINEVFKSSTVTYNPKYEAKNSKKNWYYQKKGKEMGD